MKDQMDLSDLSVLLVEDQAPARNMINQMLNNMGINQVYKSSDGKHALDFMGTADDMVNFIICDWNMPRMSGIQLLSQVRCVDPIIPFLMVSGIADKDSVMEAKDKQVSAYVAKPFSAEQLEKKIRVLWSRRNKAMANGGSSEMWGLTDESYNQTAEEEGSLSQAEVEALLAG